MKKCLVLFLLIFLTVSSIGFAEGFEIGLGGGIDFYSVESIATYIGFGGGLNAAWSMYFGRGIVGIGAYLNAAYYSGKIKVLGITAGKLNTITGTLLVGPAFKVVENGVFSMPIAVGLLGGFVAETENWSTEPIYGLGFNLTPQIQLNDKMYFFVRPQFGFNFDVLVESGGHGGLETNITLSAGVGFTPKKNSQPRTAPAAKTAGPASSPSGSQAPQAQPAPSYHGDSRYYVAINRQNYGPYDMAQLRMLVQVGSLTKETLVWKEGMAQWVEAGTIQELSSVLGIIPPPLPQ